MKLTGKSNTNSNPIPIADTVLKKCGEIGFFSGQKCNSPICGNSSAAKNPEPRPQNPTTSLEYKTPGMKPFGTNLLILTVAYT